MVGSGTKRTSSGAKKTKSSSRRSSGEFFIMSDGTKGPKKLITYRGKQYRYMSTLLTPAAAKSAAAKVKKVNDVPIYTKIMPRVQNGLEVYDLYINPTRFFLDMDDYEQSRA